MKHKKACENYIDNSKNKRKAAWEIISEENTPSHTHEVILDPKNCNNFFLKSTRFGRVV